MNTPRKFTPVCPHLGWADDQHTSSSFPSKLNYCHLANPIAAPRFNHQEAYCLTSEHIHCPLFGNQDSMSMPDSIRVLQVDKPKPRMVMRLAVTVMVFVLAFWGITRMARTIRINGNPTRTPATRFSLSESAIVDSSSLLSTMTSIPFYSQSSVLKGGTVPPSSTIRPTVKHELDAIIGTDYQFVMHFVQAGETLDQLASRYETSVDAINTINYFQNNPGWSGTLLVIPVGFTDVTMLPSFVVYQVSEKDRGVTIDDLAKGLKVSTMELKYYNDWTNDGDRPLVGDFVLVPRRRPMQ